MIVIGMYAETHDDPNLPKLSDAISDTAPPYKEKALAYLRDPKKVSAFAPGIAHDALTGEAIPGYFSCSTDGVYEWRSDLPYYLEKYNVSLPDDFVKTLP